MRGAQCKLDLNYSCRSFPKISYGNHVMGLRRRLRAGRSSASNVSDIQLSGSGRDSNLFDDEATIVDSRNTPLRPFELERYFSLHEFQPGLSLLCCSDPEPVTLQDLLSMTKEIGDDELLKKYNNMSLAYTESKGDPELRALIAANMYGTLTEDELITMVPEEGIFLTMMAAINEGDDVVVMSPGYQSLSEVARSSGANVVNWEPRIIDNDSGDTTIAFDVCDLKRLIAEECRSPPKMIVVNFPHNPTGYLPSDGDFNDIVSIAKECDAYLFSDEMYRTLEYDTSKRLKSAVDMDYEKCIVLHGLSKTIGCPGLRMGWIATHNREILARLAELKDYTTICAPRPSEILSMMAIKNREKLTGRTLEIISSNLSLLDDFFFKYRGILSWQRPEAGTICFPRLTTEYFGNIEDFCDRVRQDAGVLLLPSSVYSPTSSVSGSQPFFRLGYGRKQMPEALSKLESFLESQ